LTAVTIPAGIAEIRDGTFMDCTRLEVVSLPEHLSDAYARAFKKHRGLGVAYRWSREPTEI